MTPAEKRQAYQDKQMADPVTRRQQLGTVTDRRFSSRDVEKLMKLGRVSRLR